MTWVMSQQRWTKRIWTSEFQDYRIPLWSMRRIPAFENWFRKLRTIQIDMLFKKNYDKIKPITLSVQNQSKWFTMFGNIESCELLETEPKTRCTACLSYWNTGMIYCTCGHFLYKETRVIQEFVKTYDGPSFSPWVCHQEGKTSHGHRHGKKPGDK